MLHLYLSTPEALSLSSAFLLGLMGSAHCVGMCGGMAGALSLPLSKANVSNRKKVLIQLGFGFGRIAGYGLAGYLAGSFSWALLTITGSGFVVVLRVLTGIFMVFLGLFLSGGWNGLSKIETLGARLWQAISPLIRVLTPADTLPKSLAVGLLWGWLPCGMVYSMLVFSMSGGTGMQGAGIMLMFGLGTMPAVVGMGLMANKLLAYMQKKWLKGIFGSMIILFGLWTIWGALMIAQHSGHG